MDPKLGDFIVKKKEEVAHSEGGGGGEGGGVGADWRGLGLRLRFEF